jgi:hypothetical protein
MRRLRHGAARVADRFGVSEDGVVGLEAPVPDAPPPEPPRYAGFEWRERFAKSGDRPRVAVLLLVDGATPPHVLTWTGDQLRTQYYPDWSLLIAETAPLDAALESAAAALVTSLARKGNTVERVRAAEVDLARHRTLVSADYVLTLPAGSLLRPDALAELCWAAERENAELLYADETHVDETNVPLPVRPKPDFSAELLLASPYVGSTLLFSSKSLELARERVSSWPPSALIYDAALRATEGGAKVVRVPRVLSQRWTPQRAAESDAVRQEQRASRAHLEVVRDALWRRGADAEVERGPRPGIARVRWPEPDGDVAVIVIGGAGGAVERATQSIEKTVGRRGRVVVRVAEPRRARDARVRLKAASNGARWVVLADPRLEAFHGEWLAALLEQAGRPGVAAVSPKLLHPNGAAAWSGAGSAGFVEHAVHDVTELCAACFVAPRELVAGLEVPVDLGERAGFFAEESVRWRKAGSRLLYTPHSVLYVHGANGELEAVVPRLPREDKAYRRVL